MTTGSPPSRGTQREEIAVPGLAPAISHYTDAVRFGDLLFVSGALSQSTRTSNSLAAMTSLRRHAVSSRI